MIALLLYVVAGLAVLVAIAFLLEERRSNERDAQLDRDTGVTEGSLGAPNLEHPPPVRGTYSAASAGAGSSELTPAEGPMQHLD